MSSLGVKVRTDKSINHCIMIKLEPLLHRLVPHLGSHNLPTSQVMLIPLQTEGQTLRGPIQCDASHSQDRQPSRGCQDRIKIPSRLRDPKYEVERTASCVARSVTAFERLKFFHGSCTPASRPDPRITATTLQRANTQIIPTEYVDFNFHHFSDERCRDDCCLSSEPTE